ncbi:ABC-type transport system, substrate-binding protein [Stigmatella aurantiaca]|uniref:ABC-type transport system, substrate-binding protein n=1 Tax=Stigmatella aurantiaca TaxID=41 RepID=A0A1H7X2I8_STIAU|nr:ABC transporter substrate-binding protein [Stigmatella aurantiaca]SEM27805.1 ABC-type transport system, substrate-binding protein [Stigmatella aurantiaca]
MGAKRYLFGFGLVGGLVSALLLGTVLRTLANVELGTQGWLWLLVATPLLYLLGGWLSWFTWAGHRSRVRRRVITQLAEGDLAIATSSEFEGREDVRRLLSSLRRAISQVQRVTANMHRTSTSVSEQVRMLLEAARRQGQAVDHSLEAVSHMGESLQGAGQRVAQMDTFAHDTTNALVEMTERLQQVGFALSSLDEFAHHTSGLVQVMSERLDNIAAAGDELALFANEAERFVSVVGSGIEAVRRRANETNALAQAVTATAQRGEELVNDSVKGMYRVKETVHRAAEIVESLGTRSREIGRIVDVIQEIADQTNLLALNAAIIAAQSGEYGRPFGVVANEIRGLAERSARSTREISSLVTGVRGEVNTAVALVKEGRDLATEGAQLGDRAATALVEIRSITQRTFTAVESTVEETRRLEQQGSTVIEASQRVASRVDDVTRAAIEHAGQARELVRKTGEMARLARDASEKVEGQARAGNMLSEAVVRLTAAIDGIRKAHAVLTRGEVSIRDEVSRVREDARRVIRSGDELSRTVDQLGHETVSLESEVFRFRLPQPRAGGTLRVGIHQAAALRARLTLDPLFAVENQLAELCACVFSNLLRLEDGVLVPDLAERWEMDAAARIFRFSLRRGVSFHDGTALTAYDVKRHFERLLDPMVRSPDRSLLEDIEGAHAFTAGTTRDVSGLRVLNEGTLEIRLTEPKAFFLHLLALTPTAVARLDSDGKLHGTGPYRLEQFEADHIHMARNPTYFRHGMPWVDRLEFLLVESRQEALERLQDGQVQFVSFLYAQQAQSPGIEELQTVASSTPSTAFVGLNLRESLYDDTRVRRAIRAGLDIPSLVEQFHPGARIARTLTPPELLQGLEPGPLPAPDVERAGALLREAGVRSVPLTLYYPAGRDTSEEDAVLFRPLVEAGLLELRHVELPSQDYTARLRAGRIPAFRTLWIADYPDPDNFLYFLLNSNAQNIYPLGYHNPALDRLTSEARVSIDPDLRHQLYLRAEALFDQDCPLIPLYHDRIYAVASAPVQGLRLHMTPPQVRFEDLWLDSDGLR